MADPGKGEGRVMSPANATTHQDPPPQQVRGHLSAAEDTAIQRLLFERARPVSGSNDFPRSEPVSTAAADAPARQQSRTNRGSTRARSDRDTDVEEMLATIRRFESTARTIADDEHLTVKGRCRALLDLMARARHREGAAFLELAVWKGSRHFFEGDKKVPRDIIEANRRLLRAGHSDCPSCRRPLPSPDDLDRWRRIGHEMHLGREST